MEAERVCEVHLRVKERLLNDVVSEVKRWQKDNFHRNMMQQLKQKREMDDAFKKVNIHLTPLSAESFTLRLRFLLPVGIALDSGMLETVCIGWACQKPDGI